MKLLGRSVDGKRLVKEVRARLTARGIAEDVKDAPLADEASVEPLAFLVQGLEQNLDPSQAPPREGGSGPVRSLVRFAARDLLEELFGRQRAFNVQVRDLAAQLSVEVLRLRARVDQLEQQLHQDGPLPPRPPRARPARGRSTRGKRAES